MVNLPNATNFNLTAGPQELAVFIADTSPMFVPLMIVALGIVMLLGGFMAQARRGEGDFTLWLLLASMTTSIVAVFCIAANILTWSIGFYFVAVTLISFVLFFFTRQYN